MLTSLTALPAHADDSPEYPADPETGYSARVLKIDPDNIEETLAKMEEQGVRILRRRDNLVLAYIPLTSTQSVRKIRGIRTPAPGPDRGRFNKPLLDEAMKWPGAAAVLSGEGLPQPFDGSGVVIGICDIGFDTSHPDFLTADGSQSRIRQVVHYKEDLGARTVYSSPEEILEWRTDDPGQWHGSHVAGIAAGSGAGSRYRGVAPGADIVLTASQLSDVGLLAGCEDVIEYANSVGKPCVINLSMGNYTGPHDGTSLFSQYLEKLADEAIICLSAGNEGADTAYGSIRFTPTADNKSVEFRMTNWTGLTNYGMTDIWSHGAGELKFTFFLYNNPSDRIEFPAADLSGGKLWRISADADDPDYNETFASHFKKGYVMAGAELNEDNGRYNIAVVYDCETDEYDPASLTNPGGYWALYNLAGRVGGVEGETVDINTDQTYSFLRQVANGPLPGSELSISDLCTGESVISVGMANNRLTTPQLSGMTEKWYDNAGTISTYSSYGTLCDGRVMPLTVGPGMPLISAVSSAYLEENPGRVDEASARVFSEGKSYYFMPQGGTSMSCPYVAGFIATWLQANPQLSAKEVRKIIADTNTADYPDPTNPRHGMGWFDPLAGLRQVLGASVMSVDDLLYPALSIRMEGGILRVFNPQNIAITLTVTGADGRGIVSGSFAGSDAEFDLTSCPAGVYVVRAIPADGSGKGTVEKILLH